MSCGQILPVREASPTPLVSDSNRKNKPHTHHCDRFREGELAVVRRNLLMCQGGPNPGSHHSSAASSDGSGLFGTATPEFCFCVLNALQG